MRHPCDLRPLRAPTPPDRIYMRESAHRGLHRRARMHWRLAIFHLGVMLVVPAVSIAAEPQWISAKAYAIPPETTSEGSGYFSIIPGKDGRIYIGTAKYRENAFLVAFDPREKQM